MRRLTVIMAIAGLFIMAAATGAVPVSAQSQAVKIIGSDTMVILAQRWAEVYMKNNPGAVIQVTGGGSGVGIAALINGTTEIAQASRSMRDSEKRQLRDRRGVDAVEMPVALDGVAVYVNEKNPVGELTLEQIRNIYTGVVRNWKEVGGRDERILIYGRENSSGTYAYFQEVVLGSADYFPTTQALPGTGAVVNAVARDVRGIGYGGIAYLKGVRALKVKKDAASPGVLPTLENVQNNVYPISRFLYWYTAGELKGTARQFADWALSADGQSVVENVGYYPLPPKMVAGTGKK